MSARIGSADGELHARQILCRYCQAVPEIQDELQKSAYISRSPRTPGRLVVFSTKSFVFFHKLQSPRLTTPAGFVDTRQCKNSPDRLTAPEQTSASCREPRMVSSIVAGPEAIGCGLRACRDRRLLTRSTFSPTKHRADELRRAPRRNRPRPRIAPGRLLCQVVGGSTPGTHVRE